MSELSNWLNEMHMRIPEGEVRVPAPPATEGTAPRVPDTPVSVSAPEPTPTPTPPPATNTPGRAPLDAFLRYINAGNDTLTPELYAYFGGDDILKELQKYDPGYHWEDVDSGGGEGATTYRGKKLVGSTPGQFVLPPSKSGIDLLNLRPSNWGTLKNPNAVFHDDIYGDVTHAANVQKNIGTLDKSLPYIAALIAMGGPALGGALAGAGIGGGAGFTSSVTGGAAGLGAGSIPANAAATPWWAKSAIRGGPGALNTGKAWWDIPNGTLPTSPYNPDPNFVPTSPYDPTNVGGSAPRPGMTNESSLVANNFADDPYGFSRRGF